MTSWTTRCTAPTCATTPSPGGGLAAADLKPGSVGTSEVTADSLGTGDLAPSSVGTSEVAANSLNGGDINESGLGIVPNADTLDGLDSTSFVPDSKLRRVGPITGEQPSGSFILMPIATVGHFTFEGLCQNDFPGPGNDGLQVLIQSDVAHSTYGSMTQSQAGGQFDEPDMDTTIKYTVVGVPGQISSPQFNPASGSAVAPDGQQVTFDVYQGWDARNQPGECMFGGTFVVK